MQGHYNTEKQKRKVILILIMAAVVVIGAVIWATGGAEDELITCWVLCKPGPGNYVTLRRGPSKDSAEIGRLEVGDSFRTDAVAKNGFFRVYGMTEYLEAWIYCGFVVTEEPEPVFCNCYNSSYGRVACRRWISGPKVDGSSWLAPLSDVTVFYIADGWAVTSRGYIQSKYLEEDPRI